MEKVGGGGGGKYELVNDDGNKGFQMMPSQKCAANASGNVTLISGTDPEQVRQIFVTSLSCSLVKKSRIFYKENAPLSFLLNLFTTRVTNYYVRLQTALSLSFPSH